LICKNSAAKEGQGGGGEGRGPTGTKHQKGQKRAREKRGKKQREQNASPPKHPRKGRNTWFENQQKHPVPRGRKTTRTNVVGRKKEGGDKTAYNVRGGETGEGRRHPTVSGKPTPTPLKKKIEARLSTEGREKGKEPRL